MPALVSAVGAHTRTRGRGSGVGEDAGPDGLQKPCRRSPDYHPRPAAVSPGSPRVRNATAMDLGGAHGRTNGSASVMESATATHVLAAFRETGHLIRKGEAAALTRLAP